jgi:hypothetical protein
MTWNALVRPGAAAALAMTLAACGGTAGGERASDPAAPGPAGEALHGPPRGNDLDAWLWTLVKPSDPAQGWAPRAGLQAAELWRSFYVMGGRTPLAIPGVPGASQIWNDVWRSDDRGETWTRLPDAPWPARAYFQAVTRAGRMYVLGGQNFKAGPECPPGVPSCSDFFSDVWSSRDGQRWRQETASAGWTGRAGLGAVVHHGALYVLGGSVNDDAAVIGGPPARIYLNDVWRSYDGRSWERLVEHAPWAPRAGAVAVSKDGFIYVLGGEEGFICLPGGPCPPYFNDVWRSRDGARWELVTPAAGWSPRPGHQCEVVSGTIVCFGGFGLPPAGNPADVWSSRDGKDWTQVAGAPWNAAGGEQAKYDFAALASWDWDGGLVPAIYTFGGDRETFDFGDPLNPTRVDNDVWRFAPPGCGEGRAR